jgi:hypothetical protein
MDTTTIGDLALSRLTPIERLAPGRVVPSAR